MTKITKTGTKEEAGRKATFIISTEDVDRDHDVIKQEGWVYDNFWKNPILQVHHDSHQFPVGRFDNIWTTDAKTYGSVVFAEKGTSEVADLAYDLIKQDILRSVSVGFRAIDTPEENEHGGYTYTKQELLEVSLVNVPANQNAQVVAKEYSAETKEIIFKDYTAVDDKSESEPEESVVDEPEDDVDVFDIDDDAVEQIRSILNG